MPVVEAPSEPQDCRDERASLKQFATLVRLHHVARCGIYGVSLDGGASLGGAASAGSAQGPEP